MTALHVQKHAERVGVWLSRRKKGRCIQNKLWACTEEASRNGRLFKSRHICVRVQSDGAKRADSCGSRMVTGTDTARQHLVAGCEWQAARAACKSPCTSSKSVGGYQRTTKGCAKGTVSWQRRRVRSGLN
eukprot:5162853-Pleurochrysis_carterae.AAC.1